MTDTEWLRLVRAGDDAGWRRVWERVVAPEARSLRSAEMMRRYSLSEGDLMGRLYEDMIGRKKIGLYRGEGSFEGWLRRYVRGYVLGANPRARGELSLDAGGDDDVPTAIDVPVRDDKVLLRDAWIMTHRCFHDLWRSDPEKAYVHLLKTRFHLSSEEVRDFLDVSTVANVDQIFSRAVKFMRAAWPRHDAEGTKLA